MSNLEFIENKKALIFYFIYVQMSQWGKRGPSWEALHVEGPSVGDGLCLIFAT